MKKAAAIICMIGMICGAGMTASAETKDLKSLPSPTLKSFVSGKTFDARITGYGWGEEDDVSSLGLDFTIVEPLTYAADEIETLSKGDLISAGYEVYTVGSVKTEDDQVKVTPKEPWLTPLVFTVNEDGVYIAENEEGVLRGDSFTFQGSLSSELVYVNAEGEKLTASELLRDLTKEALDTESAVVKITFDEDGCVAEVNFSS